jgi:serine/threonine protein kinase
MISNLSFNLIYSCMVLYQLKMKCISMESLIFLNLITILLILVPFKMKVLFFIEFVNFSVNEEGLDLLKNMLCVDPQKRLSAIEVLKHPYFKN